MGKFLPPQDRVNENTGPGKIIEDNMFWPQPGYLCFYLPEFLVLVMQVDYYWVQVDSDPTKLDFFKSSCLNFWNISGWAPKMELKNFYKKISLKNVQTLRKAYENV